MTRILIVDDDDIDREAARRCLRDLKDPEILFAADGTEALEKAAEELPDLVLTDLRMPKMDGLTLVKHLQEEAPLTPVILMTSQGNERTAVDALRAGAASYVPKQDMQKHLLKTVRQILEVAQEAKQQQRVVKHLTEVVTHFECTNDLTLITPLVGYLRDNLRRIGFGDSSTRSQVSIALMEALCNAIIHGNLEVDSDLRRADPDEFDRRIQQNQNADPYAKRRVYLTARESATFVEYLIRDEGAGFDPGQVSDPGIEENLLDISGRGILLMKTFMDRVHYNEKGNELTLSKASP